MQRTQKIIAAFLVGGFILGGLGIPASAQTIPSDSIGGVSAFVAPQATPSMVDAPSTLAPYQSLETYVHEKSRLGAVSPPSPSPTPIHLNRGEKMFWGSVGLVLHTICDPRTQEFSPVVDDSPRYQTYDDARCDECDRIGRRAVNALGDGLFAPDS